MDSLQETRSDQTAALQAARWQPIALAVAVVFLSLIASRLSAIVRDLIFAAQFGIGADTDAFLTAYTTPDLISSVLLSGLIGIAFIPVFMSLVSHADSEERWRVSSAILNIVLVLGGAIALAGLFFSSQLVAAIAPGLNGSELASSAALLQIMLPSIVFFCASGLCAAVLNAHNHFLSPALSGLLLNCSVIVTALLFQHSLGIGAWAVAFVLGAFVQAIVLLPFLRRISFRYYFTFGLREPGVRTILQAALPVIAVTVLLYGRLIVERMLASNMSDGSIGAMNFANRVITLPAALLVGPLNTVVFPVLARGAARRASQSTSLIVALGVRVLLIGALPAAVTLAVLAQPIVATLYQRGAFDAQATLATSTVVACLSLALIPLSMNEFFLRVYFAQRKHRAALLAVLGGLGVTAALDLLLGAWFGTRGLALGAASGAWVSLAIIVAELRLWRSRELLSPVLKIVLAGLGMGIAVFAVFNQLPAAVGRLPALVLTLAAGGTIYLALLFFLRSPDALTVWQVLLEKLRPRPKPAL